MYVCATKHSFRGSSSLAPRDVDLFFVTLHLIVFVDATSLCRSWLGANRTQRCLFRRRYWPGDRDPALPLGKFPLSTSSSRGRPISLQTRVDIQRCPPSRPLQLIPCTNYTREGPFSFSMAQLSSCILPPPEFLSLSVTFPDAHAALSFFASRALCLPIPLSV